MTPLRRAVQRASAVAGRLGLAGLYDLPLGSVHVPAPGTELLARANGGTERRLQAAPKAVHRDDNFEQVYVADPITTPPADVVRLRGARLVGAEAVLVEPRSGRLYADSLPARSALGKIPALRQVRLLERRRALAGPACVLVTYGSHNYFHFVTDTLSRLYAFSDGGTAGVEQLRESTRDVTFILAAGGPRWQPQFLELLGLRFTVAEFGRHANVVADELVFPTYPSTEVAALSGVVHPEQLTAWLGRMLREAAGVRPGERRLYVSRQSAGSRRLVDEPEIARLLADRGFETLFPERLSVREQIEAFAAAEAVVGPHGAGLTNLLAAETCHVVELLSPLYLSPCYYVLCDALGLDHWYLVGEVAPDAPRGIFADYRIDRGQLADTLDAALTSA